jgi:rhodanese-related sulfurtransferase
MFKLRRTGKNDITVLDAFELINQYDSNTKLVILDVRSYQEFSDEHIENAENLDYNSQEFKIKVNDLDKNKKYLVYCHSGMRSSRAVKEMEKLGFTDIKNISGGISKWKGNGLPLV